MTAYFILNNPSSKEQYFLSWDLAKPCNRHEILLCRFCYRCVAHKSFRQHCHRRAWHMLEERYKLINIHICSFDTWWSFDKRDYSSANIELAKVLVRAIRATIISDCVWEKEFWYALTLNFNGSSVMHANFIGTWKLWNVISLTSSRNLVKRD